MNVRGMNILDSHGVFCGDRRGGFGAQVVPVVPEALETAAHAILERVSASPAPAEQQPGPKEPMPDAVLRGLLSLNPKDPQRRALLSVLVSERMHANERAREFIETELREDHELLVKQHRECRERGRAQEKVVNDLLGKLAGIQKELNKREHELGMALSERDAAQDERRTVSRFATDKQIAEADAALQKAAERLEQAQLKKAEVAQQRNRVVLMELPPEQEKLDALIVELNRLEALLDGASADRAERLQYGFVT